MAVLLPGLDELARRDERRMQVQFDREASLRKLRVLGTPRKQVGLAGFGLEVVAYEGP